MKQCWLKQGWLKRQAGDWGICCRTHLQVFQLQIQHQVRCRARHLSAQAARPQVTHLFRGSHQ